MFFGVPGSAGLNVFVCFLPVAPPFGQSFMDGCAWAGQATNKHPKTLRPGKASLRAGSAPDPAVLALDPWTPILHDGTSKQPDIVPALTKDETLTFHDAF